MANIKANYVGRKVYEVTIGKHTERFYEPLFKTKENYSSKLIDLAEELNLHDAEVSIEQVWIALSLAAEKAGKKFPDLIIF